VSESDHYYAAYYDLLYSNRDVKAEVDFLEKMFREYSAIPVKNVLDVGCGTGIHSIELAGRGYNVLGIDMSSPMVEKAREKACRVEGASFIEADIRKVRLSSRFDSAIAMYGVINYFTGDEDLVEALRAIRTHLNTGGLFVFDTWNVIGVQEKRLYYETPSAGFRRLGSTFAVKEETWKPDFSEQTALLEITWLIIDLPQNKIDVFTHRISVRLFAPREIRHYLKETGFQVKAVYEDYTCKPFTEQSPEMVIVARAV